MATVKVRILVGRAGNGKYYKPGQELEMDQEKARFAQSQRWLVILEPVKADIPVAAKVDKPIVAIKAPRKKATTRTRKTTKRTAKKGK